MANAPSKPTPSETTAPEAKAKKQKTITIPLTPDLEALIESMAQTVKSQHGFYPTQAQSITMLVAALVKA